MIYFDENYNPDEILADDLPDETHECPVCHELLVRVGDSWTCPFCNPMEE